MNEEDARTLARIVNGDAQRDPQRDPHHHGEWVVVVENSNCQFVVFSQYHVRLYASDNMYQADIPGTEIEFG